jgi:hypothetical protein
MFVCDLLGIKTQLFTDQLSAFFSPLYVYVCMYVCWSAVHFVTYVCMYVCMVWASFMFIESSVYQMCMNAYKQTAYGLFICMCIQTQASINKCLYTCVCMYIFTYKCICRLMHPHTAREGETEREREILQANQKSILYIHIHYQACIHTYMHTNTVCACMFICVCVCVCERERGRSYRHAVYSHIPRIRTHINRCTHTKRQEASALTVKSKQYTHTYITYVNMLYIHVHKQTQRNWWPIQAKQSYIHTHKSRTHIHHVCVCTHKQPYMKIRGRINTHRSRTHINYSCVYI